MEARSGGTHARMMALEFRGSSMQRVCRGCWVLLNAATCKVTAQRDSLKRWGGGGVLRDLGDIS